MKPDADRLYLLPFAALLFQYGDCALVGDAALVHLDGRAGTEGLKLAFPRSVAAPVADVAQGGMRTTDGIGSDADVDHFLDLAAG